MLGRLVGLTGLQISLAYVFVRTAMIRVNTQCFLVMRERQSQVIEMSVRIAQVIMDIGTLGLARERPRQGNGQGAAHHDYGKHESQ